MGQHVYQVQSVDTVVVSEGALQFCVEDLHKIFVVGPQVCGENVRSR